MSDVFSTDYSFNAESPADKDNLVFKDSETVKVHYERGSYSFSLKSELSQESVAGGYSGPFAVIRKDDTTITLCGYNEIEGRYFLNYIDIGLSDPITVQETDLIITENSWIYLHVSNDDSYNVEVEAGIEIPAQSNDALYIRIAFVRFENEKIIEIIQYQYGSINLPGRFF